MHAVQNGASIEIAAEMAVSCLCTQILFNGWHYLLENDSYSHYVTAVLDLVEREVASSSEAEDGSLIQPFQLQSHQQVSIDARPCIAANADQKPTASSGTEPTNGRHPDSRTTQLRIAIRAKHSDPLIPQITSDLQETMQAISMALDEKQRCAIDVATNQNRKHLEDCILYLKRYKTAGGRKVHESSNAVVLLVEDVSTKQRVASKMMSNKEQWLREKRMRQTGNDSLKSHVIDVIHSEIDEQAEVKNQFPYLPAADSNLFDFLMHSRVAGQDLSAVISIVRQVGEHLHALHQCGRIHGDLKVSFSMHC